MSQRDVVAELRTARIAAPPELRVRVRLIAAAAEPPRRRITWRRALVVALPVAAAVAAAAVVSTRPSHHQTAIERALDHGAVTTLRPAPSVGAQAQTKSAGPLTVPALRNRAQNVDETLSLQVDTPKDVSDGVKSALRITASLGGYPTSVHASTQGSSASASLVLKIPRSNVQAAVTRLSALGTIVAEHVDVTDAQAGLNATDRTIARLQRQLKALRNQQPPPAAQILQLEQRIVRLQRAEAAARLRAHYATVSLGLATPLVTVVKHEHGPLHGVGVALKWLGVGAVYVLAIGGPIVLLGVLGWLVVRFWRRRRDEALLSRS
jgi:hypothetical protein